MSLANPSPWTHPPWVHQSTPASFPPPSPFLLSLLRFCSSSPCCHPSPVIPLPHQPSPVPLLPHHPSPIPPLPLVTPLPPTSSPSLLLLPHHLQQYFLLSPYSSPPPPPLPLHPCPSFHPSPLTSNSPPPLLLPAVSSSALLYITQHCQEFLRLFARKLLRYLQ